MSDSPAARLQALAALADEVAQGLGKSKFDGFEADLTWELNQLTRFGANRVTQNLAQEKWQASVRAVRGNKTARVEVDASDPRSLAGLGARLEEVLRLIPESEEGAPGLAEPQASPTAPRAAPSAIVESAESYELATAPVRRACTESAAAGLEASGTFSHARSARAYVNSRGHRFTDVGSDAEFACTVEGKGGAGRGTRAGELPDTLDVQAVVDEALSRCLAAVEPRPLTPGAYPVVLHPVALEELLSYVGYFCLSAKAHVEGRSFLVGKKPGDLVVDPRVSLSDRPHLPGGGAGLWDGQGVARREYDCFRDGKLVELASDLRHAAKHGGRSTGNGFPEPTSGDPCPFHLYFDWKGARGTVDDLVRGMGRGVLVTQLHYLNLVDPMVPSFTGMTRNGTFWVENGKVMHPIQNLRFTQSAVELFAAIEAVSEERRWLAAGSGGRVSVPGLRASKFNFSSGTGF